MTSKKHQSRDIVYSQLRPKRSLFIMEKKKKKTSLK